MDEYLEAERTLRNVGYFVTPTIRKAIDKCVGFYTAWSRLSTQNNELRQDLLKHADEAVSLKEQLATANNYYGHIETTKLALEKECDKLREERDRIDRDYLHYFRLSQSLDAKVKLLKADNINLLDTLAKVEVLANTLTNQLKEA